ncbi:MAG: hypothetical protein ACHQFX_19710 [Chitinophagales bacterium]
MKAQILVLSTIVILSGSVMNLSSPSPATAMKQVRKTASVEFAFFRTHRQANGAVATWGLTSNVDVIGFDVQRTYQDPADPYSMWEDVIYMPCTEERSFKYNDQEIFAGYIYYRVTAHLNDGSSVISAIEGIRIVRHK